MPWRNDDAVPRGLPDPHLMTCPQRVASLLGTLASWDATGWPGRPRIHVDWSPNEVENTWGHPDHAQRLTDAFAAMLREILVTPGDDEGWLLLLEDDIEFHPRLPFLLSTWPPLRDPCCDLATLFNASLQPLPEAPSVPRAFATPPETFQGAQALLIRRRGIRKALEAWDTTPGMQTQRLSLILGGPNNRIWVHSPSLVLMPLG